ncbi:MAG: Spy/CpxP family protein refolding chaperone [Flavobacteriales bacterium]|jgi:Spy/CpxP family protein refolding chaperone
MKKLLFLLLFLAPFIAQVSAQGDRRPPREKIEQLRVAFLTERLNLTVEEAQSFWPLYNEYEAAISLLEKARRQQMKVLFSLENPTESDVSQMITLAESNHAKHSELRSKYLFDSMKILGPKRTVMLEKSDDDFKREVMKKLRDQ